LLHFAALCCILLHSAAFRIYVLHPAASCIYVLHLAAMCCDLLHPAALCCEMLRSGAICCTVLLSAAICCEMLRSALKCCIPSGLCRIVTVADFWPIVWFFRARAPAFPFFLSMGSHSVVAYHTVVQRSQSVDTKKIDPIGGVVDGLTA